MRPQRLVDVVSDRFIKPTDATPAAAARCTTGNGSGQPVLPMA